MSRIETRRYGLPFHGCNTVTDEHLLALGMIGSSSRDMLIVPGRTPESTKIVRRKGSAGVGSATGLLECPVADATMKGIEGFEFSSPSLTDGYPTHAVIFADESKRFGQVYIRDTNGPTDYNIGEEFSSTHYPTAASTVGNLKCIPLPYDGNGATGLTRLAYEENRRRHVAGTRKHVAARNWHYFPSYLSCPSKWNSRYNQASGSGSQKVRISPAGHCPPLWPPHFPLASHPTRKTAVGPWGEGDTFFVSCMFEWEDGSFSMPCLPRDINATLTGGRGLVVVPDDADGTVEYFDYIPWRGIPIGPPGVVRVWLLRSPKKTKTQVTSGEWPDISDLRITGYVPNGVTDYDDPNGNDGALVQDDNRVRFDHKWPDRARYSWTFDGRVAYGNLRPNPCAIVLAPSGSAATRDLNGDDEANPGSISFHVRVTTTQCILRFTSGGLTTDNAINLASTSLQQLVDTINATAAGAGAREWAAQLVPGVAGSLPATYLAPTTQDISCTKNSTTTITTASSFVDVAEGMKVSGTGIPAGTYVKSKASNTSLTLSAAATDSLTSTLTFYTDTGDGGMVSSGDTGNVRAYNGAYFVVLPFKQSYLDTFENSPRDMIFTGGGPAHASLSANNFYVAVGNRRTIPAEGGVIMGGAPLRDGCVVFGSKRIYWLRNQRSGGTGEDSDYRLIELELGRGCTSPYSIIEGNGWVGCMTADGLWVYDGERSAILSGDHLDRRGDGGYVGELAYEAKTSAAAAIKDGTDYGFFAHFRDGRIWLGYRRDAGGNNRAMVCLDCSPSVESSGINQLLRPDGTPYGWSPRLNYSWRGDPLHSMGCIFSVQKSDKVHLYMTDDENDKTTCGLVQEFESTGTYAEGASYVPFQLYGARDLGGDLAKKMLLEVRVFYRYVTDISDTNTALGIQLDGSSASQLRVLGPSAVGAVFTRKVVRPQASHRRTTDYVWLSIQMVSGAPPSTAGLFELHGIEADVVILDSLD